MTTRRLGLVDSTENRSDLVSKIVQEDENKTKGRRKRHSQWTPSSIRVRGRRFLAFDTGGYGIVTGNDQQSDSSPYEHANGISRNTQLTVFWRGVVLMPSQWDPLTPPLTENRPELYPG